MGKLPYFLNFSYIYNWEHVYTTVGSQLVPRGHRLNSSQCSQIPNFFSFLLSFFFFILSRILYPSFPEISSSSSPYSSFFFPWNEISFLLFFSADPVSSSSSFFLGFLNQIPSSFVDSVISISFLLQVFTSSISRNPFLEIPEISI